jgi:hypothetical protein
MTIRRSRLPSQFYAGEVIAPSKAANEKPDRDDNRILLRRICRTSPWVHLPAEKGVPTPSDCGVVSTCRFRPCGAGSAWLAFAHGPTLRLTILFAAVPASVPTECSKDSPGPTNANLRRAKAGRRGDKRWRVTARCGHSGDADRKRKRRADKVGPLLYLLYRPATRSQSGISQERHAGFRRTLLSP